MKKFCLILCLLMAMLLAGCGQEEGEFEAVWYSNEENKAEYVLENDTLRLTMEGSTSYFTLEDKRSGRIWNAVARDQLETAADVNTKNLMQSTFVLTYTDKSNNTVPFDAYRYAIENGTFSIRQEENVLYVDHMVGLAERVWTLPEVITVERMEELTARMRQEDRAAVLKGYRKLDPARLKPDTLAEYTEMVPLLEEGPIYALSFAIGGGKLPNYQMENLEKAFASIGYTQEDAELDRANREKTAVSVQYNLTICYRLDGDSLVVEVPTERIGYPKELPVDKISLLPYFCSADQSSEGYLLVPDGGGAQIDLHNGKVKQATYYSNVYGWDEAISREKNVQDPMSQFPVFGIAKDGGYLMAVAEGGAAEMSVEADIGGKRSDCDYVRPEFKVVHGENTTVSAKSNATIRVFQQDHPDTVISLRYIAGNSDSYVDMAQRFRAYLLEQYPGMAPTKDQGLPLVTTLVGAMDITEKTLGLPTRSVVAATDYQEAAAILTALKDVPNLHLSYTGVLNGGLDQTALVQAKAVPALGSKQQRQTLIDTANAQGATLYLGGYVQSVYNTESFDGFSPRADAIRDTTNTTIERHPFMPGLRLESAEAETVIYLLAGEGQRKAFRVLAETADAMGFAGVGLSDVGSLLYSDFHHDTPMSRQDMLLVQQEALEELGDRPILISGGNLYAVVYADCVTDMDLMGGSYDLIDRYVPFYQIALHGYVSYTGPALNTVGNYRRNLLRSVEYGAGLQFRFFEFDYSQLQNSRYATYNNLFSANFADWQEELTAVYTRLNGELGHTANLTITDHSYVADDVTLTVYEDGTKVWVNYGSEDYRSGSVRVPAEDWTVQKGG